MAKNNSDVIASRRNIESPWAVAWRRFKKNRLALFGAILLLIFIFGAVFAPFLTPHNPERADFLKRYEPPSSEHWLGTDDMGRDVLSRTLHGGRISLSVGIVVVGISMTIAIILGSIAGFFGGYIDTLIMRLADVVLSFPFLILAITAYVLLGPSIYNVMLILGIIAWPGPCRLVRAEFLKLKTQDFVVAANALGANAGRTIFLHILPNAMAPLIVSATLGVAGAILQEAMLSFLGLGVPPPTPTWGNMLNSAQALYILQGYPWMWLPPGIATFICVLSINFCGDGLRDALDPRQE